MSVIRSFLALLTIGALTACGTAPPPAPAPVAPVPVTQTPVPSPDPEWTLNADALMGLRPVRVLDYLGEPSLMRRDGPVQIALYERSSCVLELVFEEPQLNDGFYIRYINARDRQTARADITPCLAAVMENQPIPEALKDYTETAAPVAEDETTSSIP